MSCTQEAPPCSTTQALLEISSSSAASTPAQQAPYRSHAFGTNPPWLPFLISSSVIRAEGCFARGPPISLGQIFKNFNCIFITLTLQFNWGTLVETSSSASSLLTFASSSFFYPSSSIPLLLPHPPPRMSIFSKMKNAKKAADQHKDIKAQTEAPADNKPKEAPYKHVPAHALQDALAGVPSAFREQDRELIKEHNKRRSLMTRNSSYMSTASATNSTHGLPRNISSRQSIDSFGTRLSSQAPNGSETRLVAQNIPPVPRLATPNLDMNRSRLSRQGPSESYLNRQPVGRSPLASHGKQPPPLTSTLILGANKKPDISPVISPVESSGNSTSSSSSRRPFFHSPNASPHLQALTLSL